MATDHLLAAFSEELADAVAAVSPSVVQVGGHRRRASGVVYAGDTVLTTVRALGHDDGLHVRSADGRQLEAELAGWDPATSLAVLRVSDLESAAAVPAASAARVGHLALAVARSWSNAVTASAGIVAVIGGPLPTGRGRTIDEVIRTTAPMHEGFAGGAFVDTRGKVLGIAAAFAIRGLHVVIPAAIAWKTAAALVEHGGVKRAYLGLAGQPVRLPERQRTKDGDDRGLLVVAVTSGSPAETAGLLVGDVIVDFDNHATTTPEDLLELLVAERIGRQAPLNVLRGSTQLVLTVTVGERSDR